MWVIYSHTANLSFISLSLRTAHRERGSSPRRAVWLWPPQTNGISFHVALRGKKTLCKTGVCRCPWNASCNGFNAKSNLRYTSCACGGETNKLEGTLFIVSTKQINLILFVWICMYCLFVWLWVIQMMVWCFSMNPLDMQSNTWPCSQSIFPHRTLSAWKNSIHCMPL